MPQSPNGSRLAGAIASRQSALILAILIVGINAAYVFRSDSTHAKLIATVILILMAIMVIIRMKLSQEEAEDVREQAPEGCTQRAAPQRRFLFENCILAALLIMSAWRIFG